MKGRRREQPVDALGARGRPLLLLAKAAELARGTIEVGRIEVEVDLQLATESRRRENTVLRKLTVRPVHGTLAAGCQMQSEWKTVRFYEPVRRVIHDWPAQVKKELGAVLTRLQKGESIGMPDVRPMPSVAPGAAEIRVAGKAGTFRTLHVIHCAFGILVFHAFVKKSQETPEREKKTARARWREFLAEIEED